MAILKLVPERTNIEFVKYRYFAFAISAALIVASFALYAVLGLNFGIDFRGGTLIEIRTEQPADLLKLRTEISKLNLGNFKVQEFGEPTEVLVVIELQKMSSEDESIEVVQQNVINRVQQALEENYPDEFAFTRSEVVGPTVSAELTQKGIWAVSLAVVFMLCYIWFQFARTFSIGAIAALVHDVILTMGMFAFTQLEFNLSIIAAILTIVGYSMNDTVVVYDRIRENLRKYKRRPLPEVLDLSINDTLSRTVMTSVTTLVALFSLYFLGGEVIRGFTFAMIWGVFIGTYSSIFIAAPILMLTGVKRDWSGVSDSGKGGPVASPAE